MKVKFDNVGIGTTTPATKLHVEGSIYTNGTISRVQVRAVATDATEYSTTSTSWTTVKTFTIPISGDRIISRLTWKGDIRSSNGQTQYARFVPTANRVLTLGAGADTNSLTDVSRSFSEADAGDLVT